MFVHSLKNTVKTLLRQKSLMFWALIFPIILGLLFKLALGNIDNAEKFKAIDVSVNGKLKEDPFFKTFIDSLEEEDYFIVHTSDDETLLNEGKVKAHIKAKDEIITSKSGIQETIVEEIMNSFVQNEATVNRIMSTNPNANIIELLKVEEHIEDKSSKNMDTVNTYFYTLIGMQAMYGYMWGMEVMYQYEANLSTEAKRNAISPIKKSVSLSAALLVSWMINFVVVLINIAVARFLLGVNFGSNIGLLVLLVLLGALTGVAFGCFIAVSNKKDIDFKVGIGITLTMALSFLAGMMVSTMKVIIQRYAPIVNKINPVAIITDGIYSLYYYNSTSRYFENIGYLSAVTAVLLVLTFIMVRGKKYDNI